MDESIRIEVNGISTPAIYQGDWMLDKYCQLLAQHCTKREAYRQAYGVSPDTPPSTLDSKIKSLYDKHPEIPRRIGECAAELRAEWMHRLYEGLDRLWHLFNIYIGDPKTAGLAMTAYKIIAATIGVGGFFDSSASSDNSGKLAAIDTSTTSAKIAELMEEVGIEPKPQKGETTP